MKESLIKKKLHFHNKNRPELTPITEWTKIDPECTQKEP